MHLDDKAEPCESEWEAKCASQKSAVYGKNQMSRKKHEFCKQNFSTRLTHLGEGRLQENQAYQENKKEEEDTQIVAQNGSPCLKIMK